MSNFVEKYSFCGYIVDNFFDVFVGKALRRGGKAKNCVDNSYLSTVIHKVVNKLDKIAHSGRWF